MTQPHNFHNLLWGDPQCIIIYSTLRRNPKHLRGKSASSLKPSGIPLLKISLNEHLSSWLTKRSSVIQTFAMSSFGKWRLIVSGHTNDFVNAKSSCVGFAGKVGYRSNSAPKVYFLGALSFYYPLIYECLDLGGSRLVGNPSILL